MLVKVGKNQTINHMELICEFSSCLGPILITKNSRCVSDDDIRGKSLSSTGSLTHLRKAFQKQQETLKIQMPLRLQLSAYRNRPLQKSSLGISDELTISKSLSNCSLVIFAKAFLARYCNLNSLPNFDFHPSSYSLRFSRVPFQNRFCSSDTSQHSAISSCIDSSPGRGFGLPCSIASSCYSTFDELSQCTRAYDWSCHLPDCDSAPFLHKLVKSLESIDPGTSNPYFCNIASRLE